MPAILPIFSLIVLGYVLGWRQWLTNESATGLANITFKLFMPTLLFAGIAKASLAEGLSPMLLLAYYLPVLLVFGVVNVLAHWRRGTATPLGLVAAFSNNVLVGIPLIASLMGNDGLLYVFAILVFHSLTLFSLHSFYAAFGSQERVDGRALLKNLANPMIIGLGLGALVNLSGLQVPESLWRAITWLGQALALRADRARRQPVAVSPAPDDGGLGADLRQAGAVPDHGLAVEWSAAGIERLSAYGAGAAGSLPQRCQRHGVLPYG